MTPDITTASTTASGQACELRVAVMRLARRLRNQRETTDDLTLNQLATLATLARCGDLPIGDLAACEKVRPPSMTRIVSKLLERGLVTKNPHPSDRRQVLIALSPAGREIILQSRRRKEAWLALRLAELTDEERATLAAAAVILDRIAAT